MQNGLEKSFWCRGRGKSILFINKIFKTRLNHLWSFSSDEGTYKQRDKEKRGDGYFKVNFKVFNHIKETCCWNIPWYVTQNCQFKKVCRLYSTIVLQINSFFITIYLVCSSLVCIRTCWSSFVFRLLLRNCISWTSFVWALVLETNAYCILVIS